MKREIWFYFRKEKNELDYIDVISFTKLKHLIEVINKN